MSNLKTIISSFKLQDELNPKIWYIPNEKYMGDPEGQKEKLRSDIRERLLEISQYFIDSFDIDVVIDDIIITGSLVNFNWSKFSDVDLHIVIDFSQFPEKYKQTFKDFLNLKKMIFNLKHNIKVKDFDVELYAQDSDEAHFSMGTYSVLNDEWIKYPKKEEVEIDTLSIKNKSKHWMDLIDSAIEESQELELEEGLELLKKIKDKIKTFRTSGLEKGGEYSVENLVFKVLRRNGYLEKLFDFQNGLMDKKLTLNEEQNTKTPEEVRTQLIEELESISFPLQFDRNTYNEQLKKIQESLKFLGYNLEGDRDGYYDEKTQITLEKINSGEPIKLPDINFIDNWKKIINTFATFLK